MLETVNQELRKRAAALLASGTMSQQAVSAAVGVKRSTIASWMRQEDFLEMVSELAKDQTKEITEQIAEAARLSMARLIAHITATNKMGQPLWDVQWRALQLALQYELGQPVSRSESKTLEIKGDLKDALRKVLIDPTVRDKVLGTVNVPPTLEAEIIESDSDAAGASGSSGTTEGPSSVLDVREPPSEILQGDIGGPALEQADRGS